MKLPPIKQTSVTTFTSPLKWSILGHIFVFLTAFTAFQIESCNTKIITPSIQVDLVGLPELTKSEAELNNDQSMEQLQSKLNQLKPLATEPHPLPPAPTQTNTQPKHTDDIIEKPLVRSLKKTDQRKQALLQALSRIKALSAIEETENQRRPKMGNRIQQGTLSQGDSNALADDSEESQYLAMVVEKIRTHWNLPHWLDQPDLSTKIRIKLNSLGYIDHLEVVEPSQNPQFDQFAKNALSRAQPFSAPPTSLKYKPILLAFPL